MDIITITDTVTDILRDARIAAGDGAELFCLDNPYGEQDSVRDGERVFTLGEWLEDGEPITGGDPFSWTFGVLEDGMCTDLSDHRTGTEVEARAAALAWAAGE